MLYLSGVTSPETCALRRADLGLLVTPDSGLYPQRTAYPAGWAADNACYAAPPVPPSSWPHALGEPDHVAASATAAAVRYGPTPEHVTSWRRWLDRLDPAGCLFATLPDVVGDYLATWERSAAEIGHARRAGFPVAVVLQDGVEADRFVWRSILGAADAVFLGGSTEWKLSPAAAALVAEANAAGLWTHMGRVNSWRRLNYAEAIGCDSADGTFLNPRFGSIAEKLPRLTGWLDRLDTQPRLIA